MAMPDGSICWTISAEKYVHAVVKNVKSKLAKGGKQLPNKCTTPLSSDYTKPQFNTLDELKAEGLNNYQELIGMCRWTVEIGWVNILLETSLMLAHLVLPILPVGHTGQMFHTFGYLEEHSK